MHAIWIMSWMAKDNYQWTFLPHYHLSVAHIFNFAPFVAKRLCTPYWFIVLFSGFQSTKSEVNAESIIFFMAFMLRQVKHDFIIIYLTRSRFISLMFGLPLFSQNYSNVIKYHITIFFHVIALFLFQLSASSPRDATLQLSVFDQMGGSLIISLPVQCGGRPLTLVSSHCPLSPQKMQLRAHLRPPIKKKKTWSLLIFCTQDQTYADIQQ